VRMDCPWGGQTGPSCLIQLGRTNCLKEERRSRCSTFETRSLRLARTSGDSLLNDMAGSIVVKPSVLRRHQ
jgi:hypothetical protein